MRSWRIAKGHGTENDFVIVLDRHGMANPTPEDVRMLCDRRAGLGGDGLLRVVRGAQIPEWDGDPHVWFMDYRNADGSVSEMCGNGVRVFARYLVDEGLATGPEIPVGTRAGLKRVTMQRDGRIRVDMGRVVVDEEPTQVSLAGVPMTATKVDVGNPHAVAFVEEVAGLNLTIAPEFDATRFPEGVNVEFVEVVGPAHVRMRVFERGVGETRSCGTGTVAVAAAAQRAFGGNDWRVDVPGGTLHIELQTAADGVIGRALMTGPAVVHIRGDVQLDDGR
ncbi:MAG TPA: diaminopimelate epimerase [Propionibacterium sp.]|jgi:diaminopimelate epimerase|nr:diaminopimelate epimerase [Propionibacterium sp.]